jgi:hypothetical protein
MDVLERIFSSKEQFFEKTLIKQIKQKEIVSFFSEQVNNIEKFALQPLADSLEMNELMTNYLANCLAKIIGYIDIILSNKLKQNKKLSKAFENQSHYWTFIISSFFNIDSVKFIHIFYGEKYNQSKLALAWLSIVLLDRSFYDFILELYKLEFDK